MSQTHTHAHTAKEMFYQIKSKSMVHTRISVPVTTKSRPMVLL